MELAGTPRKGRRRAAIWVGGMLAGLAGVSAAIGTVPTTLNDFFFGGTQPLTLVAPIATSVECSGCHGGFNIQTEPYRPWAASMMGQATRDPVFRAALTIANQDSAFAGDFCLRCHAPGGWVAGRSEPPDGSALTWQDIEGVSCNFCHRMVDPVSNPGNPPADPAILAALTSPPVGAHSGNYVLDPEDRRRGPFDLGPDFFYHEWFQSSFHTRSNMCATCHDVSNPLYTRQTDGTYAMNELDRNHPDGDQRNMFPMERTYSEWAQSSYAAGPVNVNGRFGGNLATVSSCQDCHMPTTPGQACRFADARDQLPQHFFNGGNTWVLKAVQNLYPGNAGLDDLNVADSIARAKDMLTKSSDTAISFDTATAPQLKVRITNYGGHKLPTGYAEGRRMWINVKFLGTSGQLLAEHGNYDAATATLTTGNTKVYEATMGVDAAVAAVAGLAAGPGFHFALNNVWYKDNRIPPPGFTNANFAAVQASPVGAVYADGQNWDDTPFPIPSGAAIAQVAVYYQTTSKEYIEFLRNANITDTTGQVAYDQWALTGKSEPFAISQQTVAVPCYANCDGSIAPPVLNANDFQCFLNKYAASDLGANCDGSTAPPVLNANDFQCFLNKFAAGCT